jgi:hypothetical protein
MPGYILQNHRCVEEDKCEKWEFEHEGLCVAHCSIEDCLGCTITLNDNRDEIAS